MKLLIRKYGDPILRAKGKSVAEIDDNIRELAANMLETMHGVNGIGLAAQQVGEALQLTIVDISPVEDRPSTMALDGIEVDPKQNMPLVLVNPEIETGPEKEIGSEGCLSFPEITGDVERAQWTKVRAKNLEGTLIEIEATGLLARALQHEIDHLNGILFIDRMSSVAKASLSSRLKRLQKETERSERGMRNLAAHVGSQRVA
jgi:peptide deformylase